VCRWHQLDAHVGESTGRRDGRDAIAMRRRERAQAQSDRRSNSGGAIPFVARESSRAGVRDECFAAHADRVDRNHGDRFGDVASRSMASQLTRSTLAIRVSIAIMPAAE
jgi:hypothetical protein